MPGPGHAGSTLSATTPEAALRDLRWLLLSPPLLADGHYSAPVQCFDACDTAAIEAWLMQLQATPQPLQTYLARHAAPPLRLGRYAERLLEFFLQAGPTHRLVAANLPLRHAPGQQPGLDHTTRGEIDFLLEDREHRPWHWELAVKFFLCVAGGDLARTQDFVGPDRAETLPGKLHKLFDRQLKHAPPPPWNHRAWEAAAYTRGWMFYRHDRAAPRCEALATQHLRGVWVEHRRLHELQDGSYLMLPRTRWMSPASCPSPASLLPLEHLAHAIGSIWRAPPPAGARRWPSAQLVARMEPAGSGWHEVQRCFVVPDGWEQPEGN